MFWSKINWGLPLQFAIIFTTQTIMAYIMLQYVGKYEFMQEELISVKEKLKLIEENTLGGNLQLDGKYDRVQEEIVSIKEKLKEGEENTLDGHLQLDGKYDRVQEEIESVKEKLKEVEENTLDGNLQLDGKYDRVQEEIVSIKEKLKEVEENTLDGNLQCDAVSDCMQEVLVTIKENLKSTAENIEKYKEENQSRVPKMNIFDVEPMYGPEAGGTVVTMEYSLLDNHDLDSLQHVTFYVGRTRLRPIINETHMSITTPRYGDGKSLTVNAKQSITAIVYGQHVFDSVFEYIPNPTITKVFPLTTITAGGTLLTVSGTHLNAVSQPKLKMIGVHRAEVTLNAEAILNLRTVCMVRNSENMLCRTPALPISTEVAEKLKGNTQMVAELYIGFELDGVATFRNLSLILPTMSQLSVFANPKFQGTDWLIKCNPKEQLYIYVKNLKLGAQATDYRVLLEGTDCSDLKVDSEHISCQPPEWIMEDTRCDKIRIKVLVGNLVHYVGMIEYVGGFWTYVKTVLFWGVFIVGILATLFGVGVLLAAAKDKLT